jgi:hypothetical protein
VVTLHRPPSQTDIGSAMASTPLAISERYNPKCGFAAVQWPAHRTPTPRRSRCCGAPKSRTRSPR